MGLIGQRHRAACQMMLETASERFMLLTSMPGCSCSSITSFPLDEPVAQSPDVDQLAAWELGLGPALEPGWLVPCSGRI